MSVPQNFRSSFNGFNREDVVHYIEYINSRHNTEVNQLRAELENLQTQSIAPALSSDTSRELRNLRQERNNLLENIVDLENQVASYKEKEQALEARCAELEAALLTAKAANSQPALQQNQMAFELETYRRAERTERVARERAEQIYLQTNSALADATAKVDNAAAEISQMSDAVLAQLNALQAAVAGSKSILKETLSTMYAICPKSDSE